MPALIFSVLKPGGRAGSAFSRGADYGSATFKGEIDFINAKFGAQTSFAVASFANLVPDFRGATMHEATEWHGVTWPTPKGRARGTGMAGGNGSFDPGRDTRRPDHVRAHRRHANIEPPPCSRVQS